MLQLHKCCNIFIIVILFLGLPVSLFPLLIVLLGHYNELLTISKYFVQFLKQQNYPC